MKVGLSGLLSLELISLTASRGEAELRVGFRSRCRILFSRVPPNAFGDLSSDVVVVEVVVDVVVLVVVEVLDS